MFTCRVTTVQLVTDNYRRSAGVRVGRLRVMNDVFPDCYKSHHSGCPWLLLTQCVSMCYYCVLKVAPLVNIICTAAFLVYKGQVNEFATWQANCAHRIIHG